MYIYIYREREMCVYMYISRYGVVWCGMVWCGMVWYSMVWCAKFFIRAT